MSAERRTPEQWQAKRAIGQRDLLERHDRYMHSEMFGLTPLQAELQRKARKKAKRRRRKLMRARAEMAKAKGALHVTTYREGTIEYE
jgi:hypothetical protein